jgi:serine/threonine protein kinase
MILRKLNHINLSNLEDVLVSKPSSSNKYRGSVYLSFKFMDHDLYGLVHSGKVTFTVPQIKNIVFQILSGLNYLHSNKTVHRDLKSSNILMSNKGEIRITDFGLAKSLNSTNKLFYTRNVVTLWYRAPEILLGSSEYDFSIDLWSVGCILCELLLYRPPFNALTEREVFFQINDQLGAIRESNYPGVSKLQHYDKFKVSKDFNSKGKLRRRLEEDFSKEVVEFAMSLLEVDPRNRISCEEALKHSFFTTGDKMCLNEELPKLERSYFEMDIRNRENKDHEAETLNTTDDMEKQYVKKNGKDMQIGEKYNNYTKKHEKDSFLKNKRKSLDWNCK